MKNTLLIRFKILVLSLFFSSEYYGYINGPTTVARGSSNNQYTWGGSGQVTFSSWSTDNINATMGTTNPGYLTVSNNISDCKIAIIATYNAPDPNDPNSTIPKTDTLFVYVDPYLTVDFTTIYPGQAANITCTDNCENEDGHTACLWDWGNPSGVNCLGCGNNSLLNSVLISFPNQGTPASHVITCVQKCDGGQFQYGMDPVTINYKLHTPTISGPAGTACNGVPSSLIYTANQDSYAGWYTWTVPTGWTINGSANGNQISVTSDGTHVGAVTAKAYFSNGSAICSDLGSVNIACCPSIVYATGSINSGSDLKTAVSQVIATSVIGNGADAKYHAGDEVILDPGFSSVLGSSVHAYGEPGCNESYYRVIATGTPTNDSKSNQIKNGTISGFNQTNSKQVRESGIKIFPNPNDGKFNITFFRNSELPIKIIIFNSIGEEVRTIENPENNQIEIDLKDNKEGLYLVSIQYLSKIETRKVIKQ